MDTLPLLTEARIQQEIVFWYRNEFCLKHQTPRCIIFSIPNSKNPLLRETGMMPGASDLQVIHNRYIDATETYIKTKTIFVEVKTPQGRQSPNQKKFQAHIEQMNMKYCIVRSLEQFKTLILNPTAHNLVPWKMTKNGIIKIQSNCSLRS